MLVFDFQMGVPILTCQRRLRRLLRDTRQISGHLAQVTVYEEARGELRYSLYLADHAARVQLKVGASSLGKVLQDCSDQTGERQAIMSEDASCLLVPITDRLVISPSRTAVFTMGAGRGSGKRKASSASQGYVLKIRYKVCYGLKLVPRQSYIALQIKRQACCYPCQSTDAPHCTPFAQGWPWTARASCCLHYLWRVSRYYRMGARERGASTFDCVRPNDEHDLRS